MSGSHNIYTKDVTGMSHPSHVVVGPLGPRTLLIGTLTVSWDGPRLPSHADSTHRTALENALDSVRSARDCQGAAQQLRRLADLLEVWWQENGSDGREWYATHGHTRPRW